MPEPLHKFALVTHRLFILVPLLWKNKKVSRRAKPLESPIRDRDASMPEPLHKFPSGITYLLFFHEPLGLL
jgi:hypothetical protein